MTFMCLNFERVIWGNELYFSATAQSSNENDWKLDEILAHLLEEYQNIDSVIDLNNQLLNYDKQDVFAGGQTWSLKTHESQASIYCNVDDIEVSCNTEVV